MSEAPEHSSIASGVARRLKCEPDRADTIVSAVMCALRDGLSAAEAETIVAAMPPGVAALWPSHARSHPELPEVGGEGFLGRVRALANLDCDSDAASAVHAVFDELIGALGLRSGGSTWSALASLPPAQKTVWMRLFRAATFPVERLAISR